MPPGIEQWDDGPPFGRVRVTLSDEDGRRADVLGEDEAIEVTDLATGERLEYRPADCGLGCFCAAEVRWLR